MKEQYYKDFFYNFIQFKEKQNKQKQRGLNDFNIFSTLRKKNAEVGLHSNFIFSLLNPNGEHYQNELFLNLFIEDVLNISDFGNITSVKREDSTDEQRRIDFTIESDKYLIGIEMKSSYARGDEPYQLSHYKSELEKDANGTQKVLIYYLTLDGKSATKKSLLYKNTNPEIFMAESDYIRVSFNNNIFTWIEHCYNEVNNITNLAVLLTQYKEIVQHISRKDYKGKVMSIKDFIFKEKDKNNIEVILEIDKEMYKIKGKILFDFFNENVKSALDEYTILSEYTIDDLQNLLPHTNQLTEKNCINSFQKARNTPKHYGLVFDCQFGANKYFFIKVARTGLYYGVICLDEVNDKISKKQNLEDFYFCNDKLNEILNPTYERCAKHFGDIKNLKILIEPDKIIKNMLDDIKEIIKSNAL